MVLWCDFFSGWISGMAGLLVGHPIDTIKVRQQVDPRPMLHVISHIRKQGRNQHLIFFRGMGTPLLTNGIMNSVYFGFYGGSLDQIVKWQKGENDNSVSSYGGKQEASYSTHYAAGCIGGVAQLVISCPVDLVKVQLQSRLKKQELKGPVDCVKQIVKSQGIFGLYKGIFPQFFRDVPASGLYFVIYEYGKRKLDSYSSGSNVKLNQFIAGGSAGMLSWWSILPLDVIKSRVQGDCPQNPKYKGMMHCARVILKVEGIRGMFQGFWPLTIRAFPVNGTTFLVYEYLFEKCKELNHNGLNSCEFQLGDENIKS